MNNNVFDADDLASFGVYLAGFPTESRDGF